MLTDKEYSSHTMFMTGDLLENMTTKIRESYCFMMSHYGNVKIKDMGYMPKPSLQKRCISSIKVWIKTTANAMMTHIINEIKEI